MDTRCLRERFTSDVGGCPLLQSGHGRSVCSAPRGQLIRDLTSARSHGIKTAWIELIGRKTLAQAASIHVTAELEGAELRALGLRVPRIDSIPTGRMAGRSPAEIPDSLAHLPERYVLFLSRISWKKGLDRLITAWQWVPDVPLVVAGNDDENYRPKLEALARSVGVADSRHIRRPGC